LKKTLKATCVALGVAIGAVLGLNISAAHAGTVNGVTCNPYRYLYPSDGTAYPNDFATASQTDVSGHLYVCSSTLTHTNAQTILTRVQTIPSGALALLKSRSVYYFYFANRMDNNNYLKGAAPFSGFSQFQTNTARCGKTGYGYSTITKSSVIASSIFDKCSFSVGTTPPNPNIGGVTLHESGHAFDFSIASISPNMAVSPSTSYAFSDVVGNVSGSTQTAASDFYYLDSGKKNHPLPSACQVFDSAAQSALELDLGGPNDLGETVCNGNTENPDFTGMENTSIAYKESFYFLGGGSSNSELFAQLFAKGVGTIGSPDPTPFVDSVIQNGSLPCSRLTVNQYISTQTPPTTAQLQAAYCFIPTAADWDR